MALRTWSRNHSLMAGVEDMARYAQEINNVRAALDWAFSPAGARPNQCRVRSSHDAVSADVFSSGGPS